MNIVVGTIVRGWNIPDKINLGLYVIRAIQDLKSVVGLVSRVKVVSTI